MSQTKIAKRKINSFNRFAYPYGVAIFNKVEKVRKEFIKRSRESHSPAKRIALLRAIIKEEGIGGFIRKKIIDNQVKAMELQGSRFLKELDRKKRGLRPSVDNTINLEGANKETLKDFNYEESVEKLRKEVSKTRSVIDKNLKSSGEIETSYGDIMEDYLDKMDDIETTYHKKLKKVSRRIRKRNEKYSKSVARDNSSAGYQQGEVKAAGSTKLRMMKRWQSQFDGKVRTGHARVNEISIFVDEKFSVPYEGGVDLLVAPKVAPIHPSNFFNCRCFLIYQVQKKP